MLHAWNVNVGNEIFKLCILIQMVLNSTKPLWKYKKSSLSQTNQTLKSKRVKSKNVIESSIKCSWDSKKKKGIMFDTPTKYCVLMFFLLTREYLCFDGILSLNDDSIYLGLLLVMILEFWSSKSPNCATKSQWGYMLLILD